MHHIKIVPHLEKVSVCRGIAVKNVWFWCLKCFVAASVSEVHLTSQQLFEHTVSTDFSIYTRFRNTSTASMSNYTNPVNIN